MGAATAEAEERAQAEAEKGKARRAITAAERTGCGLVAGDGAEGGSVIAVLFARADSVYKTLPDVEVYDIERDARTYDGPWPVVAHPPCRSWGRLRAFAKPRPDERNLARMAVSLVRELGGVLEHPAGSTLWAAQKLPFPGQRDSWGGWTLAAPQKWWGHRAEKSTWFYIVGCDPSDTPAIPLKLGRAEGVIRLDMRRPDGTHIRKGDSDWTPRLSAEENEHTPPELAQWLVDLARRCAVKEPT